LPSFGDVIFLDVASQYNSTKASDTSNMLVVVMANIVQRKAFLSESQDV
jgi:hypothetical protein